MKSHPFEIGDKVFCKTNGAGVVVYVTDWMADVVFENDRSNVKWLGGQQLNELERIDSPSATKSTLTPLQASILLQILSENILVQVEISAKVLPSDHPKKAEWVEQLQARFYGIQHLMPFAEQLVNKLKHESDAICQESVANFEQVRAMLHETLDKVPDFKLAEKRVH